MDSSNKKFRSSPEADTEPAFDDLHASAQSISARRIADLESQLEQLQGQLAAANGKLQSIENPPSRPADSQETTRSTLEALKASLDRKTLALAFAEIGTC
ncbi:MAG: hypothetical protein ABI619_07375, partial [Betaproteobacteria bacterium]